MRDGTDLGKELRGDAAQGAEHGPPSVDQLDLTVRGEGLGVGGQTGCVPAVVTCKALAQVSQDDDEELSVLSDTRALQMQFPIHVEDF